VISSLRQRIDEVAKMCVIVSPRYHVSFETLISSPFDEEQAHDQRLWKGIEFHGKTSVSGLFVPKLKSHRTGSLLN